MGGTQKLNVRASSLGALEKIFFLEGVKEAAEAFGKVFAPPVNDHYYVHRRPDDGAKVLRTDAKGVFNVDYESFDPPSFWQNPYQLMRVKVHPKKPSVFYSHDGEEFVIPIDGPGVNYDFFWAAAGTGEFPKVCPKGDPLLAKKGEAIRIHPQIPHRAWGAGNNKNKITDAWMITRPLANTAGQIYLASSDRDLNQSSSRQIKETDLEKNSPGQYALLAWGISESIRLKRLRSNLRIAQVAKDCDIDAAHLSKIESGSTNVSLETLMKLCRLLDIDVGQLVAPPSQPAYLSTLSSKTANQINSPLFETPSPLSKLANDPIERSWKDHFIHPQSWRFDRTAHEFESDMGSTKPSTWIVISGRAVVDMEDRTSGWKASEVLDSESVIHLRQARIIKKILPLESTVMLQIVFDPEKCWCSPCQESPDNR